jgi:hypothetical protein
MRVCGRINFITVTIALRVRLAQNMQRRKSGTGELAPGRAWSQAHRQYHEHAFKQHHKDGKLLARQVSPPSLFFARIG